VADRRSAGRRLARAVGAGRPGSPNRTDDALPTPSPPSAAEVTPGVLVTIGDHHGAGPEARL